jgi:16S rRNA (adenine1518-N6/adenine1519-N6)-dimethyltransferase
MQDKRSYVYGVFQSVASGYDKANTRISLGLHKHWKGAAVSTLCSGLPARPRILDIGCGTGDMLLLIAQEAPDAELVGLDFSPNMLEQAQKRCQDLGTLALVQGDALRVTPQELAVATGAEPNKLVSNLPYQVAATVILGALQNMPSVRRVVVMVQAEVADRISAQPGTKAYGAYTAKLALYGQVTGRFEVGPGNFMPPPHVDSAVVRIDRAPMPCEDLEDLGQVAQVIDAAFAQRRKTIRNSMAAKGFDKTVLDEAFAAAGIDPRARAESLSPADFVHLARAIAILGAGSIL